jgi:hypothetical protein
MNFNSLMTIEDLKPGIQSDGWTAAELRLQLSDDTWAQLVKQLRKDTAQLATGEELVVTSADIEKDPDFFIGKAYLEEFFSSH